MKILISDKINETSLIKLKENGIGYDYLPEITPQELIVSIQVYNGLIVRSRTKVTKEVIRKGNNLKVIGRVGSGVDNIDIMEAKKKNILVVNSPGANSQAVSELTVALILSFLRKLDKAYPSMKNGLWLKKELTGSELCGKTVGIIGYGNIGKKVEKILKAFGAEVLIYSRSYKTKELQEIFQISDIITIHLPLNKDTKGFISDEKLAGMKKTAFLVNTSRGEIIDENALLEMVSEGKIAGCALDVYSKEPLPIESPWRKLENVILTPHIGASTREALRKGSTTVIEDIVSILKGKQPKNLILK